MRLALIGILKMLTGVALLFAMVVGVIETGIFLSFGAYALVIVGLLLAGFGLASIVEGSQSNLNDKFRSAEKTQAHAYLSVTDEIFNSSKR